MDPALLRFEDVTMTFDTGRGPPRRVLRGVDLELPAGSATALVGRSGSGKSTLLHLAAGILVPSGGRVLLDGRDLGGLSERERTLARRRDIGLVFQFFHLLPHLNVAENVALPGWVAGRDGRETRARAAALLERVGLADRADEPVGRLSGGEMQRVALCRALLRRPRLVLADEPTGSLDERTGSEVMDLLLELTRAEGGALLYVTHSRELAGRADVVRRLQDGAMADNATVDEEGAAP